MSADNMRQQNKSSTTAHVYTHDAWNRLVKVQLDSVPSSTAITLNESEYNGLHWRTVKRADTTSVPNGLDQKRVMYYSAAWQMIQEDIDHSYTSSPGTNDRAQQVWGLRYIDDAVTRRTDSGANGSYESTYYYITDAQFSVVAILNSTGVLQERVRYGAYGKARHSWPSDVDGDGDSDTTDSTTITGAYGTIGATAYNADCDINRSGTVDATDLGLWIAKGALPAGEISHLPDNSVGYCGYLFNKEFQVYTVRFRDYDPVLGRWLERDPLGYIDGANLYQYSESWPLATDAYGLVGGTKHHPYPLYLGGSDNIYALACEADHQAAHNSIDEQLKQYAAKYDSGSKPGWRGKYSWHRGIWRKMSDAERKSVLRNSLKAANVQDNIAEIVEESCVGATPGKKQSRGCSPGVISKKGNVVKGVGAAILLAIAFEGAGSEAEAALKTDMHCANARRGMDRIAETGSCDELQNVKNDVSACFLSLGVSFEQVMDGNKAGGGVLHGVKTWDDLVDKCYDNERKCCGSDGNK